MQLRIAIPIPPEDEYPNYFAALEALGAEGVKVAADVQPELFDGLLLPGGGDVDPVRYRQPLDGSADIDPALDELQFAVTDRFVRAGIPVFGICRGHQLLNVYFGGTLIQDLPHTGTHDWDKGQRADKVHEAAAEPGSWIARLYGERFATNSAHHQAAGCLGNGLIADMWTPDGVVEAMHHTSGLVHSVQWHPERMCFRHRREDTVDGSIVLDWFLAQCRDRR